MPDTKFKPIDITGQVRGYLTALRRVGAVAGKSRSALWECLCICGNTTKVSAGNFRHGHVYSCGCMRGQLIGQQQYRHGHCTHEKSSRTYITWTAMRRRCEYPKDKEFHRYGAAGIKVCERWSTFDNFLADMGERPQRKTLDRIDNARGYEPENCRWATYKEQVQNRAKRS